MRQTACELLRAFIFVPSVTLLHGIVRDILLFLSVYLISSCDCCSCIRRDLFFLAGVLCILMYGEYDGVNSLGGE